MDFDSVRGQNSPPPVDLAGRAACDFQFLWFWRL